MHALAPIIYIYNKFKMKKVNTPGGRICMSIITNFMRKFDQAWAQ